jgi:hypothetical protein
MDDNVLWGKHNRRAAFDANSRQVLCARSIHQCYQIGHIKFAVAVQIQ